jgi:hypothetical protein
VAIIYPDLPTIHYTKIDLEGDNNIDIGVDIEQQGHAMEYASLLTDGMPRVVHTA